MTETDPVNDSGSPIFDDLERRRRRREHPFVDDLSVGELEPLLGTPEPDNVPQVGQATPEHPQAEGHALQPGEELGVETEPPATGVTLTEAPVLTTRVVVSAMPSSRRGEQTVVAEVYSRSTGDVITRWIRTLPDPAPLCPEEGREHELAFATGIGELEAAGAAASWQVTLYVCGRCPYAETDDSTEPAPTYVEPEPDQLELAAYFAESREIDPDRAAELRSRKDRGGRSVEREGQDT